MNHFLFSVIKIYLKIVILQFTLHIVEQSEIYFPTLFLLLVVLTVIKPENCKVHIRNSVSCDYFANAVKFYI